MILQGTQIDIKASASHLFVTIINDSHKREIPNAFFKLKEIFHKATPNYYFFSPQEFELKLHGLTDSCQNAISFY